MFYTESWLFINTLPKFAIWQVTCHFVFIEVPKLLLHIKQVIKMVQQRGSIILFSKLRELEFS
jgi:hypothetical protein